jgi:hypothetical protein
MYYDYSCYLERVLLDCKRVRYCALSYAKILMEDCELKTVIPWCFVVVSPGFTYCLLKLRP